MSIRPSECAQEASRFSLRDALLGNTPRTVRHEPSSCHTRNALHAQAPIESVAVAHVPVTVPIGQRAIPLNPMQENKQLTITFQNMLLNKKAVQSVSSQVAHAPSQTQCMTPTAAAAISRIQEIQARKKTLKPSAYTQETTPVGNSMTAPMLSQDNNHPRMLPSGYVSGGRVGIESASELIRLSGIVDSLNEKINAQSHKLQRTEASLIKANQQITNERESGQARLTQANERIRKLTESEAKLVSVASTIHADQSRSNENFKSAVKKFQDSEEQMQAQKSHLDAMTRTNVVCSEQITQLKADLLNVSSERDVSRGALEESEALRTGLMARIEELTLESKPASDSSAATENASVATIQQELATSKSEVEKIKAELELQRSSMGCSLESLTKDRDVLSATLEATTSRFGHELGALKVEKDEIYASVASLVSNNDAITAELSVATHKLSDMERQRDDALKQLESSRRALKQSTKEPVVDVKKLTSDLSTTQGTLRTSEQQRIQMSNRLSLLEKEMESDVVGQLKLQAMKDFENWAAAQPLHSNTCVPTDGFTSARSDTCHYKASSYKPTPSASQSVRTVVFERTKRAETDSALRPGRSACATNARRAYESKRFCCDGHTHGRFRPNMLSRGDMPSTKASADGNKLLEKLVVAVSKDVVSAIVDARRSYMLASGVDEEDADQQLMPFAVAPIGNEEDRE